MMLTEKQAQFNNAMAKYETMPVYLWVGRIVSFLNVGLQSALALLLFRRSIGVGHQALVFAASYVAADFVNALVHMYMDNNDDYLSPVGPLVASFHLHHKTPRYKENHLLVVYYHEAGAKIWLAIFMSVVVACVLLGKISDSAAYGLLYFSILSCIAEVSHYLCHAPNPAITRFLGRARILLYSRHHSRHHAQDNVSYAFLNAMSDPLINVLARFLYKKGYKSTTDTHYAYYTGAGTANRP